MKQCSLQYEITTSHHSTSEEDTCSTCIQSIEREQEAVEGKFILLECFCTDEKYDPLSADCRGVPTRLISRQPLSKQQQRRVEVLYKSFMKTASKKPDSELKAKRDKSSLPSEYWSDYPSSVESCASSVPRRRLGVDVGGVIATYTRNKHEAKHWGDGKDEAEDTQLHTDTLIVENCFECLSQLVEHFGPENTFIVSKAGPSMAARTTKWLHDVGFFTRTNLRPDHVYYVKERHLKADVVEKLGITHFIDDRWSVLCHLTMCKKRYLFPGDDQGVPTSLLSDKLKKVKGWTDVVGDILSESVENSDGSNDY